MTKQQIKKEILKGAGEFFIDCTIINQDKLTLDGEKTHIKNYRYFWKLKNRQARINWINREIKKLKKC